MRLNAGVLGRISGRIRRARLRTRVLAGVLAVTLAALVGFDIAAVSALHGYLIGQTDRQLQSVLNLYRLVDARMYGARGPGGPISHAPRRLRPAARPPPPHFTRPRAEQVQAPPFLQPFTLSVVSGRTSKPVSPTLNIYGQAIGHTPGLTAWMPHNLAQLATNGLGVTVHTRHGDQLLRLMATPMPGGQILVAMTSLDGVTKTVSQLELILIIGSAAAGLLAAGGVAWIMRRGLRPVETMAGQADRINAGDLTERVSPHDSQTEVGRLGSALNGMLSRIQGFITEREASQQATRRFFTDASHELRTPLASLRANAELYLQGALTEREQVDEAMLRIAAEAKRMGGLVDDMLRLARLDQHPERSYEQVDVSALAEECTQRARTAHPGHHWHADVAGGLATTGDEELLRRAIDNLLANVAAHTPDGTTATVTAARSGDTVTVEVSDDGPGVLAAQLPHIFERFYRGRARSARPGSGLGLAIVAAATAAHYGTAVAAANDPHGLRVTVTLPAADPDGPGADLARPEEQTGVDQRAAGPDGSARGSGPAGGALEEVAERLRA